MTTLISRASRLSTRLLLSAIALSAFSGCAVLPASSNAGADESITANVQSSLAEHTGLEGLTVQTVNGVVYLSGEVSTGVELQDAEAAALATQKVSRVVNSISVDSD